MDDRTPVTHDYEAFDNEFTGTIRKIVIGVGPVGEAFESATPKRTCAQENESGMLG